MDRSIPRKHFPAVERRFSPPRLVEVHQTAGWRNAQLEVMRDAEDGRVALVLIQPRGRGKRTHEWVPLSAVRRRQIRTLGDPQLPED